MNKQYLVIDFECLHPNEWQSVGIVLYEKNTILRQFHTACERGYDSMTVSTRDFWKRHPQAFDYNLGSGKGKKCAAEEVAICSFIETLKRDYPNFHLLSDAPEYDIGLINEILLRNGHQIMSHRSKKIYFQTICTWSSKKTLDMMGILINSRDMVGMEALAGTGLLPHTPIFDCMQILNEYLCVLHTISIYRGGYSRRQ
jgi:hypothetical protein